MYILQTHSLTRLGRFDMESEGLTLAEKDGSVRFVMPMRPGPGVPELPEIGIGTWLQEEDDPGAGTVWRIKAVETDTAKKTRTYTAEHIIQALGDTAIFGEITPEMMGGTATGCTAEQAATYALSRQNDWRLGGIGYAVTAGYSFNGDSVMEALESVASTLEDCWWSYDLSVYPFLLYLRPRDRTAGCEMRGGRNLLSMRKTVDASKMYTRVYPIGADNLHITGDYVEANTAQYGVISRVLTDQSKETEADLRLWALGRLRRHCEPANSVTISGLELSQDTGEPLDQLTVGRGCLVPLPEYGTHILDTIVRIQWRDKKRDRESCTVTLSNTVTDVASIIRQERSEGSGASGRAGRGGAKKAEEDHAWFVDTTDHVAMVAEAVAGEGASTDWSRVSSIVVDGNGIHQRVTEAEGEIVTHQSWLEQTERSVNIGLAGEQVPANKTHQVETRASLPTSPTAGHYYYIQNEKVWVKWDGKNWVKANLVANGDGTGTGYTLGAAEIAMALNDDGSTTAKINADRVYVGRVSKDLAAWAQDADGLIAEKVTAAQVRAMTLTADEIETFFANIGSAQLSGGLHMTTGDITTAGDGRFGSYLSSDIGSFAESLDVNGQSMNVADISISGNTMTITYVDGTTQTFSKAATLSVEYGGSTETDTATYTVTGSPAENFPSGSSVTGEFTVKVSKTAAYVQDKNGTIRARIDNPQYGNGWAAAYGKVKLPTSASTASSFDVETPPATVDGAAVTETYTLSNPMNDVAVVKNKAGTIVGRLQHGQYTAGWAAARDSVDGKTYTDGGTYFYNPTVTVTEANRKSYMKVAKPSATADGALEAQTYYLTNSKNKAQIRYNGVGGAVVAELEHLQYNTGWQTAASRVTWPSTAASSTEVKEFQVKVPPTTADEAAVSKTFKLNKGTPGASGYASVSMDGFTVARIDISDWYTDGQDDVSITKGAWSQGVVQFTKSAGTANTKEVRLVAGTPSWSGNTATVAIWDGTGADAQHGSNTGYSVTVDASAVYNSGYSDGAASVSPETPTITYVGMGGSVLKESPEFTVSANGQSNSGWITMFLGTAQVGTQTHNVINACQESNANKIIGRIDIQGICNDHYSSGYSAGHSDGYNAGYSDGAGSVTPEAHSTQYSLYCSKVAYSSGQYYNYTFSVTLAGNNKFSAGTTYNFWR